MKIFKKTTFIITFTMLLLSIPYKAYSELNNDVKINVLSDSIYYDSNIRSRVELVVNNKNLINDQCFLAYHIYDENNNEVLWEGDRKKIELNDDGKYVTDIDLSLFDKIKSTNYNKLILKFDIIDQKNIFWFSTNDKIDFKSDNIIYENNAKKRFIQIYSSAFRERPILMTINIILFFISILACYKYYKFNKRMQIR